MIYQILTPIFLTLVIGVSIFSVGIYFPYLPKIGEYSSLITSFFSLHSVIFTLFLFACSLILVSYNNSFITSTIAILSLINLIAWSIPVISLYLLAYRENISLSAIENLTLKTNRGEIEVENSIKYYSRDNQDLYLDYYPAYGSGSKNIKPLAYVHGGGFTGGHRSEEPAMIEFFRQQGYSVFDIGYSLADENTATWDIAGREIQTALNWIGANATAYNLDIGELVVAGSSAGGTLALLAAYSGNDLFPGYEQNSYTNPKKVITLFPAVDIETLWERDTEFYGIKSRDTEYIGGTPQEYPERYERVNTIILADKNAPETLIIHGGSDTLIPSDTVLALNKKLTQLGVSNTLKIIPFAQHGYTYFTGSFGFQISRGIMKEFLNN